MAIIWIASWCIGFLATHWRDELNPEHDLTFWHKALGSSLLFLILLRLAWRLTHPAPVLPPSMSPLMQRGAVTGHVMLYAVALIALPLSGWFWSSVADKPIMVLGLFQLPALVGPAPDLYDLAKSIHTYTSWFCGLLVVGHVLIALKHHFVDKDNVLNDMLPARQR